MKVVQINTVCKNGSTGKICASVSELLTSNGIENYIFHTSDGCDYPLARQYMSGFLVKLQALKAKVFGNYGFQSEGATKKLIKELEELSPDIVHLHNLHGHNVQLETLFSYLREKKIKIFWTFHDCFAFTAYCMYFDMVQCDKWMTGCYECPQHKKYSWFSDRSKELYLKKKKMLSGLDLTVITPSNWLAELVKKSFLKDYPIEVIHNGIDLNIFKPSESKFRENHGISDDKTVLLGVANNWEKRKGLDTFIRLSEKLDNDRFSIVLVGTNDETDKILPKDIISIHRTSNQQELAAIYSAADCFVNPTLEDNFPTVNLEALACGTPVITFNTGGSAECLVENCGAVIQRGDFEKLYSVLVNYKKFNFSSDECVQSAERFNQGEVFKKYLELYSFYEHSKESNQ